MEQSVGTTRSVILDERPKTSKSRCYILTLWQETVKHFEKAVYEIWCDDESKDGKHHMHHVIYFKNPISFNTIKKAYPKAHIEPARNVYDAIHYIKDNKKGKKYNIQELGNEPKDTRFKSVAELKDVKDPEELDWKQFNTWQRIHANDEVDVEDLAKDVEVYYISGPSGSGKTERAKQIIRENKEKYGTKLSMVKHTNEFWMGVGSGRNIALYDDFRDSHMKASEFINFIDYNRHPMNIKGGSCTNDYQLIIITSVQPLCNIYRKMQGEPRQQWLRRVTEIQLGDYGTIAPSDDDEVDVDSI